MIEKRDWTGKTRTGKRSGQRNPPEDGPSKATVTIGEIDDNRYYYRQWRDGDRIRSTNKPPVNPDE